MESYFLWDFFLGLGSEDLGTESTVLMAAFNRSNGVLGVVMRGIIPLPYRGVYNDSLSTNNAEHASYTLTRKMVFDVSSIF